MINWDEIFTALEKWRDSFLAGENSQNTSVTALAESFGENDGRKPWAVLVSTILSLRTKDEVTRSTSAALLGRAPDPASLLAISEEESARLAYPAGFYRNKAASLRRIARILLDQYGGEVPREMDALLALPGVGRKSANLILTEAFGIDAICVDIHVHRICNRAGWTETANPDKTESALREILPRKYWQKINALLVLYGQQICRPISPWCSRCVIASHCAKRGLDKVR